MYIVLYIYFYSYIPIFTIVSPYSSSLYTFYIILVYHIIKY